MVLILSRYTGPDLGFSVGGGGVDPFWGGFGLQHGHSSVKMYAKMKELGPVGGACTGMPPRSAYGIDSFYELLAITELPNNDVTSAKGSFWVGDNRGFWRCRQFRWLRG